MEYVKHEFENGKVLEAEQLNHMESGIDFIINGIKASFITGKFINQANGTIVTNADWNYCETYFNVAEGDIVSVQNVSDSGHMIIFYNSDKTFVSSSTGKSIHTVPSGVSFIRINVYKTYLDTISPAVNGTILFGAGVLDRLEKLENSNAGSSGGSSSGGGKIFHIGSSYSFTRLRDGIAEAVKYPNSLVYVHPGVYDLKEEFSTEIASQSGSGIGLKNNVHVIFERGAYVKALFDNSNDWAYVHFEPFYAVQADGGFTLENLDIEASNTRYCVHDEHGGHHKYINKYINCRMQYTNTRSNVSYIQCIGGGTGENGLIVIDGGYYKSSTTHGYSTYGTYGTPENCEQPISYHNGAGNTCNSRIIIKNVYLANRGYFRFGNYGASTIKSHIEISNCSTGLPILNMFETTDSTNANFDILAFGNIVREEKVPFDFSRVIDIIED